MTYTPTVPQANQTVAATQPLISANFSFLPSAIGVEHNFDDSNAAVTYHLQASLPNMAIAETAHPTPTSGADGILYAQAGGPGTAGESGIRYYSTSGNTIFRLCDGLAASIGFQWIGKVMVQWGLITLSGSSAAVTFLTPFPNNFFNVQLSISSSSASTEALSSYSQSVTGFSIKSSKSNSSPVYWFAIGN